MSTQYKVPVKDLFEWQSKVLSMSLATPPALPTKGDRYIVPSGASGAWSGQTNKIAEYDGSLWSFITPNTYFTLWVASVVKIYYWNGSSWVDFAKTQAIEESKRYALLVGGGL